MTQDDLRKWFEKRVSAPPYSRSIERTSTGEYVDAYTNQAWGECLEGASFAQQMFLNNAKPKNLNA